VRERCVFQADLARIAGRRSGAWRWTELHNAIIADTGCGTGTASRLIIRGVQNGLLRKQGYGVYELTTADSRCGTPELVYRTLDRRELLTVLAEREAWPRTTMLRLVQQRLGVADTTLRASLAYAREYGYLELADGRWALTPLCRKQLALYGRLEGAEGFRFACYVGGSPKRGLRSGL
jgi:hypothetical protein